MTELERAEAECERILKLAHEAPLNPYRLDADGHRWVEQVSSAWKDRGREWMEACERRDALRKSCAVGSPVLTHEK